MKTIYNSILKYSWVIVFGILLSTSSCVDYLDKSPDSDITSEEVFSSFNKYQGFVEDLYEHVVQLAVGSGATHNWNFGGDEMIVSTTSTISGWVERGDFWQWTSGVPFNNSSTPGSGTRGQGYWGSGWYGIRKANMALENIDLLLNATQEEKNVILGQAYFFRAYFHFEILRCWGHIAYIDVVYGANDIVRPETESYRAVADRIEEDLLKAIPLLPADWDQSTVGLATLGNNAGRITKGAALAYLGLNRLYAASPLMHGEETGNFQTYNTQLCQSAAEAYYEVIKLANQGTYILQPWSDYRRNFWTDVTTERPLISKEIIFSNVPHDQCRWLWADHHIDQTSDWNIYSSPTDNYVRYFGMANGLPFDEPDSGWDPSNPWANRDPRFYYNIVCDGDPLARTQADDGTNDAVHRFFVGGRHRGENNSHGGYGYKKYLAPGWNTVDNWWNDNIYFDCPKVRLAGVYLEYAEAANEAWGPNGGVSGGLTAVQAVNIVRARAGVPEVDARFLVNKETFRETIRQERAVELAFEAHRWFDLRRWYIADQLKYREKYALDFDEGHTYFQRSLYITTVFEPKHWWLPFRIREHTAISPIFKQNPGW
jgi:hypothetical protein